MICHKHTPAPHKGRWQVVYGHQLYPGWTLRESPGRVGRSHGSIIKWLRHFCARTVPVLRACLQSLWVQASITRDCAIHSLWCATTYCNPSATHAQRFQCSFLTYALLIRLLWVFSKLHPYATSYKRTHQRFANHATKDMQYQGKTGQCNRLLCKTSR